MNRDATSGQAALEWVGTVVVVAVMVAAVAVWAAREIHPPERPPDPIGAVAEPLGGVGREMSRVGSDLPRLIAGDPGADLGHRVAGWIGRTSRSALTLGRDMGAAFGVNFGARMRERVRGVLDDPPTGADLVPDPAALAPGAIVRDLVHHLGRDPGAVLDYVRMLRGMPPRQAAVRVAGDAGTVAADGVAEATELLVKRLILRGLTRIGRRGPQPAQR
jgi:hypothetical protein